MGVVYKARQVSLDRIVALKMMLAGQLASAEDVQRFRTEAAAAASLQHPNIVAIHEVGEHERAALLLDGLRGGPEPGRAGARQPAAGGPGGRRTLKTIAEAIHYAHQRGILHRDLKPSNVLIDDDDQPRITDFGLAKRLESDSELTLTGARCWARPNYMPPEQARAATARWARHSDVYSLGAILYSC